jgi:Complex1_LYR-like
MPSLMQLYRGVLRLHRCKLPPPMKAMGDKYVKTEFLAHIKGNTTEQQWQQFLTEWTRYRDALGGEGDVGQTASPDVLGLMNPEQQSKMAKLYEEAKGMRKQMIEEALPFDKK